MKMRIEIAVIILIVSSKSAFAGCFESIISFGDSQADAGNYNLLPHTNGTLCSWPPFGRTFFNHPTGRCSDGRLVIDFIAQSFGLPLLPPYIGGGDCRSFSKGVNFAVIGATVLGYKVYEKMGIQSGTNVSLANQLDWCKQFLAQIPDGRKFLQKSLVVMGGIGGNDYNHPLITGSSLEVVKPIVPPVIARIGYAVEELIKFGAETLLVPGILPMGCLPFLLTQFKATSNTSDYDPETGCLSWLNTFSMHHNELLQKELNRLQELYPHVAIIYGDLYNNALRFYLSPNEFGFREKDIFQACCGAGGPYNYNSTVDCGVLSANSCDDPSSFIIWDGIHFTDAAYKLVAQGMLEGPYTNPQISTICPSISRVPQVYEY